MIVFLATRGHTKGIDTFLRWWSGDLVDRFHVMLYDEIPRRTHAPVATYVFADLERLTVTESHIAGRLWDELAAHEPPLRLLNDPRAVPSRPELLHAMYQHGQNRFRVTPLRELLPYLTYPVFVRERVEHSGSLTALLPDEAAVARAHRQLRRRGYRSDDLLLVEFCDTSDGHGLYRKWSMDSVGHVVLPRHLLHSRDWVVKYPTALSGERYLREELEFVTENPHHEQACALFEAAHVDYGRLDYAMIDGTMQVWEINTNPVIFSPPDEYSLDRRPSQEQYAERLRTAFAAIDCTRPAEPGVPIEFDRDVVAAIRTEKRRQLLARARRYAARKALPSMVAPIAANNR